MISDVIWLTSGFSELCGESQDEFWELSSALHSALRDDPGPFRKTVKELLSNLLELVERLDDEA